MNEKLTKIINIISHESLFNLSSKVAENLDEPDISKKSVFGYDTLHDDINTVFTNITKGKSELENDMLDVTKAPDGDSVLKKWEKNSNIVDINDILTDIIDKNNVDDDNYVCYLRDVYKGSIICGLNNLLDMAGASNESYIKERKIKNPEVTIPLEKNKDGDTITDYFKFDKCINDYIKNEMGLGLGDETAYVKYNIDNLNFFWQYLLCYCYLSISKDAHENGKHSVETLRLSFYLLRNICFCSFEIIKGYNSINYIRYPCWSIGYNNDDNNSLKIYNFFNSFWDGMSNSHIERTNNNMYPYSLSQRVAALEIKEMAGAAHKYVIPRKADKDNSKEKKLCLQGFHDLLDEKKIQCHLEPAAKEAIVTDDAKKK
jgi:hypothetical protein